MGEKKYRTIVIDPPWDFDRVSDSYDKRYGHGYYTREKDFAYETMTDDQICDFDIDAFIDPVSCGIFIWATHGKVPFVFNTLLDAWNLKYSSQMTWHKNSGSKMNGVFRNSEFAVFAYRGRHPLRTNKKALPMVFYAPATRHSEKPAKFYGMIGNRTTPEPRIDIFARRRHPGFDAWGDQVESGTQQTL